MKDFNFTFKGILALLSTDGINSKGKLKKSLESAKISDLECLKRSIQEEIRLRKKKLNKEEE